MTQTAVSAGINTVMRTIGGSLGATVGRGLLTASISATGYPTDLAYTVALLGYAAALTGACLLAAQMLSTRHDRPLGR